MIRVFGRSLVDPCLPSFLQYAGLVGHEVGGVHDVACHVLRVQHIAAQDAHAVLHDLAQQRFAHGAQVDQVNRTARGQRQCFDQLNVLLHAHGLVKGQGDVEVAVGFGLPFGAGPENNGQAQANNCVQGLPDLRQLRNGGYGRSATGPLAGRLWGGDFNRCGWGGHGFILSYRPVAVTRVRVPVGSGYAQAVHAVKAG